VIIQPYVAVMRVLRAEMMALGRCHDDVRQDLKPWFRMVRSRRVEPLNIFLGRAVDNIAKNWSYSGPAFVELAQLPLSDTAINEVDILHAVHDALREKGVSAQPVVHIYSSQNVRDEALALSRTSGGKLGLRISPDDFEDPYHLMSEIKSFLGAPELTEELDLLVDLERVRPHSWENRDRLFNLLNQLNNWTYGPNSITLIGSSLPEDYEGIPRNSIREVIKAERELWRYMRRSAVGSALGFGDHVVVRTNYVDQAGPFPHINGKILYSTANRWVVCRGTSRQEEPLHTQHERLAEMLVGSAYFIDEFESWGDTQLVRLARRRVRTGSPREMLEICASHHLTHMARATRRELAFT
jgi:hypothetical protein